MEDFNDLNASPLEDYNLPSALKTRIEADEKLQDPSLSISELQEEILQHLDNYQRYAGFVTSQRDLPLVSARQYATSRKIRKKVDSGDYDFVNTGF